MKFVPDQVLTYLPASLITILTIRCAVFGAGVGDAIAFTAISGLYGFKLYLDSNKTPDVNADIKEQLDKIKSEVGQVALAASQKQRPAAVNFRF